MSSTSKETEEALPRPRSALQLTILVITGLALFSGFLALGTWQLHRLGWKLDLIARVNSRVNANPVAAPGPADWKHVNAHRYGYLHVRIRGHFLPDQNTLVRTSTRKGRGFWVMTPLKTQRGFIVLVNRGFLAANQQGTPSEKVPSPRGQAAVTGLLRTSQPGGGFLHPNDPVHGRWYSRDVAAITAADQLPSDETAPYFIDADASSSDPDEPPLGGMTVIHFRNAHLAYALTWYALAGLVVIAAFLLVRFERRKRHDHADQSRGSSGR